VNSYFRSKCKNVDRHCEDTIFKSRFGDSTNIYWVIQATRRPSRLQCYGDTFSFWYFKTLSIDPAPEKASAISRSAVKRSTDWAGPDPVKTAFLRQYSLSILSYFFSLDERSYSNLYFDQEIKTDQIWKISPFFIHLN